VVRHAPPFWPAAAIFSITGAFKPLHMLGGYGHLSYLPLLGQPSHTPRAQSCT